MNQRVVNSIAGLPAAREVGESLAPQQPQAPQAEEEGEYGEVGHGRKALHRQWGPEHIAHRAGVSRPVHAELELLDQARHHTDGDVDHQQGPEEPRQPQVLGPPASVPGGLEQGGQQTQPDGHRDEQEVVDRRHCELQPRQIQLTHVSTPIMATRADSQPPRQADPGRGGRRAAPGTATAIRTAQPLM